VARISPVAASNTVALRPVELKENTRLVAGSKMIWLGRRPVEISTNLANSKVIGKLLAIGPRVDERTGSVAVRASVPAGSGFLPGQFVKLSIATDEHPNVVSVPVESLVKDPDVGYVISIVNGDIQTQKPVRVGIRDGDFVEVEGEGVKVGMTVVSSGAYALPRQSKVRVITPLD
jgi:membrane fusion protein (multidrug efflux system)